MQDQVRRPSGAVFVAIKSSCRAGDVKTTWITDSRVSVWYLESRWCGRPAFAE